MEVKKRYKVAVVGAGASGLVAAKMLLTAGNFNAEDVVLIEETDQVGGVWNRRGRYNNGCEKFVVDGKQIISSTEPVYDNLSVNLPTTLMAFQDFPFPVEDGFFPGHERVLSYLHLYAEKHNLFNCILFNQYVESCSKVGQNWMIKTKKICLETEKLIVCTGHFRNPYVPPLKGLRKFSGLLMHSSAFKNAKKFENQSVLIVGGSVSGADIAGILSEEGTCAKVMVSVRTMRPRYGAYLKKAKKFGASIYPDIERIEDNNTVVFKDGHIEQPSVIIFATGYRYAFPFLKWTGREEDSWVSTDGYRMQNLYNRVFFNQDPSLSFIGTSNLLISPFMVFEYQAHYIASVLSGKIKLPSLKVMNNEIIRHETPNSQDALLLKCPGYCNSLANLSGFRGYFSQLLFPRLFWTSKVFLSRLKPLGKQLGVLGGIFVYLMVAI